MLVDAYDNAFFNLVVGRAPAPLELAEAGWETLAILLMLQQRSGFFRTGERISPDDDPVVGWTFLTASEPG